MANKRPSEIADRLGGWMVGGIGESYGDDDPPEVLHRWMELLNDSLAVCPP